LDPDPELNEYGSTTLVGAKSDLKYSDAGRDDNGLLAGALQAAVDEVLLEGVQRDVEGLQEVALNPVLRILIFTHSESRIQDPGSRTLDPKTATKEKG
jgi:hypothetical protein